ncbi:GlxA family transcriptional regulator [soil metagenome]
MTRRIGILLFDGVKTLDFVGPAEVFVEANQTANRSLDAYEVVLLSPDGNDVQTSIGARIGVHSAADAPGTFDTVLIPGSEQHPREFVTPAVLAAARSLAGRTRRLASICSGAFVLAELGALAGRRGTTHWKFAADLATRYPDITVEPDSIFVRDGHVYSSAGVAAGIDLALALVEEDHGADVARQVAQLLLVYMQRSGGQSQFSAPLRAPAPQTRTVRSIVEVIERNPAHPFTLLELARHANISVRHLTRLFRDELHSSPSEYITELRYDAARICLEAGSTVSEAAQHAGFASAEALRRVFVARLGISPSTYQKRFRTTAPQLVESV